MGDFIEVDFIDVEARSSGDAIAIRIRSAGQTTIHVVDGGFLETGQTVVDHITTHYGNPWYIDRVVVTHPDGDHAAGLRTVLESFSVGELWMLRPWIYANELLPRFSRVTSAANLERYLKEAYPHLVELESIANRKRIPIREPFLGARIGPFTVLAPSRARYLNLVVSSDRTPEAARTLMGLLAQAERGLARAVSTVRATWGVESFSAEETSSENEMSVVQVADILGQRFMLTGDAGRGALAESLDCAPLVGYQFPGVDRFQVPHHGSRRNVSTDLLDRLLGPRLGQELPEGSELFTAIISSAELDADHPRKAVVRAMIHRGGKVITTEGKSIRTGVNAPPRDGWGPVKREPYPPDQEE